MRILFLLLPLMCLFADTTQNIKNNEQKLQDISNKSSSINIKLKRLGNNINDKNRKIAELKTQIDNLVANINVNEKLYEEQESLFNTYNKKYNELDSKLKALQKELVDVLLKDMAIYMILNSKEPLNEDSIIFEEALKTMSKGAKKSVEVIINEQNSVKQDMKSTQEKIDSAKAIINAQKEKKKILEIAKKEQENLVKKLNAELTIYNDELKRLDKERVSIQKILVGLNILKKQETQNQEQQNTEQSNPHTGNFAPLEVRQIGNSYRIVSTARYNGAKTIAPLKSYKIETRYGPYYDPVYKMKVFNEFVTFSVRNRSNVLAVLDGKIVFAKETPMLKNVIVIEHKNGLHTIYSYIDNLANIKVGSMVKKGTTIAYVNDKLHFEVTQKDKHINPLQLINVR